MARAMAFGWHGDFDNARAHVKRALKFAPDRPYIAWWAGAVYASVLFDQFQAARHLMDAYRMNPEFIQAILWLAGVASHLGDYDTTETWLENAKKIDAHHTGTLFRTGDNLLVQRDWQGFRDHADAWLQRDPTNMVGNVYGSAIHRTRAFEAYENEDMQTFQQEMQSSLDSSLGYIRNSNDEGESKVQFWNSWAFMAAGYYAGVVKDRELATRMFRQLSDHQEMQTNPDEIQVVISYAALGEHDKAIEKLNTFLAQGFSSTRHLNMFGVLDDTHEVYGNIRNNVGFIDVVTRMREQNANILARLRSELPRFFPAEERSEL